MKLIDIAGFPVVDTEQVVNWDEAMTFPAKANADAVGGFTDWVLPDLDTLKALASLQPGKGWFWSSSPHSSRSGNAWSVNFYYGFVGYGNKFDGLRVRLVRAGQCLDIVQSSQP